MPYEHGPGDRPQRMNSGLAWACSLAVIGSIFGVALAVGLQPVELRPGCRLVGSVQRCDKPSPSPTSTTPRFLDERDGSGLGPSPAAP